MTSSNLKKHGTSGTGRYVRSTRCLAHPTSTAPWAFAPKSPSCRGSDNFHLIKTIPTVVAVTRHDKHFYIIEHSLGHSCNTFSGIRGRRSLVSTAHLPFHAPFALPIISVLHLPQSSMDSNPYLSFDTVLAIEKQLEEAQCSRKVLEEALKGADLQIKQMGKNEVT